MGLIDNIKMSVENSVIEVVLRKGKPVVPAGEERTDLPKIFRSNVWSDSATEKHIKGGYILNPENGRWETADGCGWVLDNIQVTNDSLDEVDGEITLEVSGMTCTCGQAVNKTIRYTDKADLVLKSVMSSISKNTQVTV